MEGAHLFLRICMQSFAAGLGYTLSEAKRGQFAELRDEEVSELEAAVRTAFEGA